MRFQQLLACVLSNDLHASYKVILDVPTVGGRLLFVDIAASENIEQAGQIGRLNTCKIIRNVGLKIKKSGTIKNLKTMLRWKYGIPESQREHFFDVGRLMDCQKLVDCGVHGDSTLHPVHREFDGIKIHVKLPSNPCTMVVEVRTQDNIRNIEAIIKTKEARICSKALLV
ncbi:hypothetical protein FNV43_RR01410 [Rhamnella rubrinervis]|uniref:Ubiquitin-like domain-containing protein n=1 Tax=Rhamnella rubrinervis TaxID=2594499 RepID=A0A8K0MS09_9ROSA|nr:hypothetical protein FNV43_RR01410 [Rhamnella rubrinervis]